MVELVQLVIDGKPMYSGRDEALLGRLVGGIRARRRGPGWECTAGIRSRAVAEALLSFKGRRWCERAAWFMERRDRKPRKKGDGR